VTTRPSESESGAISKVSDQTVAQTVDRLLAILKENGVQLFAVIDQAAEARKVGLELRDTVLVIFGNPKAGTPVMDAEPLSGLDLPLKLLIWDNDAQTTVSYYSSETIAQRYVLSEPLRARLAAIDTVAEALVAS
jgi:uncharacterized protein (DUF302 family)